MSFSGFEDRSSKQKRREEVTKIAGTDLNREPASLSADFINAIDPIPTFGLTSSIVTLLARYYLVSSCLRRPSRINRGHHDLPLVAQYLKRHVASMPAQH